MTVARRAAAPRVTVSVGEKLMLTVEETVAVTNLGRDLIYEYIGNCKINKSPSLKTVMNGRRRLVPRVAIERLIAQLMGEVA